MFRLCKITFENLTESLKSYGHNLFSETQFSHIKISKFCMIILNNCLLYNNFSWFIAASNFPNTNYFNVYLKLQQLGQTAFYDASQEDLFCNKINNLEEKITKIGQTNFNLQQEIQHIKKENNNFITDIKMVKAENKKLKEKIENMEKKTLQQDELIQSLIDNIGLHDNKLTNIQEKMAKFDTLNTHLEKQNTFVSFTAFPTETRDYNAGDVVQFDGLKANYGNHYDNENGIFVCPFSGYYLFTVSLTSTQGRRIHAVIQKADGYWLAQAQAEDETLHGTATNVVVVFLQARETVWVETRQDGCQFYGSSHSSFHGTLLRVA